MEQVLLTDKSVFPDEAVLREALGAAKFKRYRKFMDALAERGIVIEWRTYDDAKSWLGKLLYKKKNLGWLSVWDTGFRVTVYVPARVMPELEALGLGVQHEGLAREVTATGKSCAILTRIDNEAVLSDVMALLEFRRDLK